MDKLIDYTKYTLALAVGLFLYIPANFLPAKADLQFWILTGILVALFISIISALLLYSRATKLLIADDKTATDPKKWTRLWGSLHIWILILAFAATSPFYVSTKILARIANIECSVQLPTVDGQSFSVMFPCNSTPDETSPQIKTDNTPIRDDGG